MKMEIYLVRHGKTKGNEEHRYVGRTDEALSEAGIREKNFKRSLFTAVPCSDAVRLPIFYSPAFRQ